MEESTFKDDIYDGSDFTARRVLSVVRDARVEGRGAVERGLMERGGEETARKKEGSSRTFASGIRSEPRRRGETRRGTR